MVLIQTFKMYYIPHSLFVSPQVYLYHFFDFGFDVHLKVKHRSLSAKFSFQHKCILLLSLFSYVLRIMFKNLCQTLTCKFLFCYFQLFLSKVTFCKEWISRNKAFTSQNSSVKSTHMQLYFPHFSLLFMTFCLMYSSFIFCVPKKQ